MAKNVPILVPSDPSDEEDFDTTKTALDRAYKARLVRTTRQQLGLTQQEFAVRFKVPVGTLRDWEQVRSTPPDFAIAYVNVIRQMPETVANLVA